MIDKNKKNKTQNLIELNKKTSTEEDEPEWSKTLKKYEFYNEENRDIEFLEDDLLTDLEWSKKLENLDQKYGTEDKWLNYTSKYKQIKEHLHLGTVNIFNLIPISIGITTEEINALIKEKNIVAWCISDLNLLTTLKIDDLTPIKYYFEPITNFSVPSFNEMNNIVEFLYENSLKGNILVSCQAGHGRTGIVLSVWAGINGTENPIQYIRDLYCSKAVETLTQEMFVNIYLKYLKQLDKR